MVGRTAHTIILTRIGYLDPISDSLTEPFLMYTQCYLKYPGSNILIEFVMKYQQGTNLFGWMLTWQFEDLLILRRDIYVQVY